jgi:Mg-chelatase subunit ChlD
MTRARTSGVFARQLHRAAAQRGKLDPLYQDLSDHWTRILQRLYPVWVLIGPGLSDPGHIEIRSRQIYLDSDALLGPREQLLAGMLQARAVLRCFGVALHETFHAKHTKRWVLEHDLTLASSTDPADRRLAEDRRLLEEPRMEAHGVREHPPASTRGRFVRRALQAAVIDVILPAFTERVLAVAAAGAPITRDMAGRAAVYLQARTHYEIVDPAALHAPHALWQQVLGTADMDALDALFARAIWIPDGELEPLDQAAREYRAIIGPPDPPPAAAGGRTDDTSSDTAGSSGGQHDADDPPPAGSLAEAVEQALASSREQQLEQLDEDPELGQVLKDAADRTTDAGGRGTRTGRPSGRLPDRGVDRPAMADEIQQARRYATRLRQALRAGTRRVDKRTPGGRFDGRAYTRARAQRQSGRPVTTHPWQITRTVTAPIEQPHVGLVIDTSGSMGVYEYALGPICWILTDALRQVDGRLATALFGDSANLLSEGAQRMSRVPAIRTGGGTAFAGDAIDLICEHLEMTNPRRPRLVYVLSDGGWVDTQAGVRRIRWLAGHGVPTIHLSIGIEPLGVECDRIHVITDPAQAMDHIAADTVAALTAATRRRPTQTTT